VFIERHKLNFLCRSGVQKSQLNEETALLHKFTLNPIPGCVPRLFVSSVYPLSSHVPYIISPWLRVDSRTLLCLSATFKNASGE
jgi:hypothetical protein